MENRATKWAVEGTEILLATGLLTVTLAWLISPRVGKRTAKSGLHKLVGGLCALTSLLPLLPWPKQENLRYILSSSSSFSIIFYVFYDLCIRQRFWVVNKIIF